MRHGTLSTRLLVAFVAVLAALSFVRTAGAADRREVKSFETGEALVTYYERTGYTVEDVLDGRYVILSEFPRDFGDVRDVDRRKRLFQRVVLPLIYLENERIRGERKFVRELLEKSTASPGIPDGEKGQLAKILDRYEVPASPETVTAGEDSADTLLRRVRRVPPSLVLAQAATESGWGTSRFCLKGNNLFGQRTYNDEAPGLKPTGVNSKADFKVRKFSTLLESVRSYMNNLNTHSAYERFRRLRDRDDRNGGLELVQGLTQYSERRGDYVESIRSLIQYNDFSRFDGVRP